MTPKSLAWFAFAAFSLQMVSAQDFQRSYTIPENGVIFIDTSGNIKVQGYDGQKIEVLAYKKGSNSDSIEIADNSSENRVDLRLKFSRFDPGKFDPAKAPPRGFPPGRLPPPRFVLGDSSVDFEFRVPKSMKYESQLRSIGGSLEISDVSGRLLVSSNRGKIDVKNVHGFIVAVSHGGGVRVDIAQSKEPDEMSFRSNSGDVVVKAPGNLDAIVVMSSESGRLNTDFPIEIQEKRYGPGREAYGKLGSGKQKLTITTMWGSVSLIKK
jgi:hypothetical protein